jgi:hypothetical protein
MRRAAFAATLFLLCAVVRTALGRNPPIAVDPREGVWIGGGEVFIHQTTSRWSVFPAGATVNKLAVDDVIVWIATDDGVIRFDSGSRRSSRLTMADGLPSQMVKAVAVDEQFVWFATNKGLVRYRKVDRTMKVYTDQDGLPHKSVNDALTIGRQVWFATRDGIAVYSPDVDGLRSFGEKDGLAWGDVLELLQVGDDLWCRTDEGLSRFRIKTRVFSNFSKKDLGASEIRSFTLDGDKIWIGTDNGMVGFESASDAIRPFPQQAALKGKDVKGVEVSADYIYITTDKEVVQFNKATRAIRRFTLADGLTRTEGALGTLIAGGLYTVAFPDGAVVLDVGRDLWVERKLVATESSEKASKVRVFGTFNGSTPYDITNRSFSSERYATAQGGFGIGQRLEKDRQFNGSVRLDYGQIEQSGIRDLQYKLEYLGNQKDAVREVQVEDKLKYRYLEEGLERPLLLQGAHARLATPGQDSKVKVNIDGGFRRGVVVRDFLTGPRQEVYQLTKKYIIPGTERVYVDGELLTSGTDYSIVYPAGQLAFLNPERLDDLSVVFVEYEYDVMPRKDLGTLSVLDMLPADREVGDWQRAGEARMVAEETALYNQIDGAAPKYIDRGWSRSVYAEFRQGSRTIQVAIHDMTSESNAEGIFSYDLPAARQKLAGRDNVVLDMGLATAYATKAHTDRFYIELSIDEKSDAAKESLKLFTLQILDRKEKAGANTGDQFREWIAAVRTAVSPGKGVEVGARAVERRETKDAQDGTPAMSSLTGVADARYQKPFEGGGTFTSYGELGGSHRQDSAGDDGWAGMGLARLSHPSVEGTLSGRYQSSQYTPLGSDRTRFGRLQNEGSMNVTGYPASYLPTTVFFTRQQSYMDDAPRNGIIQHALARFQVNHEKYPSTSVQVGHTMLDNPQSFTTNRLQAVGQTEYDLARVLGFTGIKRFNVRALYSVSQAETERAQAFAYADRVQLSRIEGKFSPTATESFYTLYRTRILDRQAVEAGAYDRGAKHWELYSGAQSAIIPGLLPSMNYTVAYDDNRLPPPPVPTDTSSAVGATTTTGIWTTTPPGPGDMKVAPSGRSAKTTIGGTLGIYPGQWWVPASPVVIEPRVSVSNDEKADEDLKTSLVRQYRFDNRAVYAGSGKLELEFFQLYQVSNEGQDQHPTETRTELRNRVVFRPIFISPITLRVNYLQVRSLNDPAGLLTLRQIAALAGSSGTVIAVPADWANRKNYEAILEWLMRWNKTITTRIRAIGGLGRTIDFLTKDDKTHAPKVQDFDQYRGGGELELRFFPLQDTAALYVFQRDGAFRLFGFGDGAMEAVQFYVAGGTIWRVGDNLYLDGEVIYRQTVCLEEGCMTAKAVEPRLLFTVNL